MVDSQREQDTEQDPEEETAAREAAEFAVELSESPRPQDRRRIAGALGKVTRSAGHGLLAPGRLVRARGPLARPPAGPGGSDDREADAGSSRSVGIARSATAAARGTGVAVRRTTIVVRQGAEATGRAFSLTVNWLTGQVLEMGPRLRIRDQATLREQFPGRTNDQIADLLIERAARASAAVGGATGAWSALPALPAFPAEIAAETLAITGIEIKLVAELHEAYGLPAPGNAAERARAYIASWAHRRGVYIVPGGLLLVAGSPLAGQVRRRLAARIRRSTISLAPLFTGAVAGAMINRRETRRLGNQIRDDIRGAAEASVRDLCCPRTPSDGRIFPGRGPNKGLQPPKRPRIKQIVMADPPEKARHSPETWIHKMIYPLCPRKE
ncbi:MAG: hypothetical protein ACRDN0_10675 [Trebonia sp.]